MGDHIKFSNTLSLEQETVLEIGKFTVYYAIIEMYNYDYPYRYDSAKIDTFQKIKNFSDKILKIRNKEQQNNLMILCEDLKQELLKICERNNWNVSNKKDILDLLFSIIYDEKDAANDKHRGTEDEKNAALYFMQNELNFSSDALLGLLVVCHRIRNNLFHGLKDEYKLDNQKSLFICLNKILNMLSQPSFLLN